MIVVWDTTIYWANCCTLWLFMKTFAFCTFIGNNEINIIAYWFLWVVCIN